MTQEELGAHSTEFAPDTPKPVVVFMPESSLTQLGGTMRLGSRATHFIEKHRATSKMHALYDPSPKTHTIYERHRHRYEVNPEMVDTFEQHGMLFVGRDDTKERMEIMELKDHPFYVATQYHPEYKSRPLTPSPPFLGLVLAASQLLEPFLAQQAAKRGGEPYQGSADIVTRFSQQQVPQSNNESEEEPIVGYKVDPTMDAKQASL